MQATMYLLNYFNFDENNPIADWENIYLLYIQKFYKASLKIYKIKTLSVYKFFFLKKNITQENGLDFYIDSYNYIISQKQKNGTWS